MHRAHHLYQVIIALSVIVSSCGQLGIADFDLGPDPSTAVGPYKRVAIIESPHGLEFDWVSAAPCPNESLLIIGGTSNGETTWLASIRDADEAARWETFTQSVSGLEDAAIHCTESSIFVFGVGQTTEGSRLGYLWELTLENGEPTTRSEHSYPVAQSANSPSLRVDRDHIDTLYWDPEDANDMKLVGKRFQRSTLTEQSEVEFVTTINEAQQDVSLRLMTTRERQYLPILTGYGRLEGSDETWIQKGDDGTPEPLETGERYTSQTLIRWKNAFWIIGTRLRPSVPLGLVLSTESDRIPTLQEVF
ncbi:MAG: hypothetical protein VX210_16590 [Myxococcota bacterium]|nr:hypothetical protein [Myxococcota bacterium]